MNKLIKKTQKVVNAYIRDRDKECYGVSISDNAQISDAGHYFSTGSHPGMRFRVDNIHGQSRSGNCFKSGDLLNYRKGLLNRHGEDYVKNLEFAEKVYKQIGNKWDYHSVQMIKKTYQHLHNNKIWVFDQKEFDRIKVELIEK